MALLIEHYAGAFPCGWLRTGVVIPTDRQHAYALEIKDMLRNKKVRVEMDDRNEKVGYKIREAQVQKIPYMLVIGDKEVAARSVAVRHREQGDLGAVPLESFLAKIKEEIDEKK